MKVQSDIVDIYKLSATVVAALDPHAQKIRKAIHSHNLKAVLEVVLTITPDESISTPIVGFDPNVIAFLNKVGASIDIDIYRGES